MITFVPGLKLAELFYTEAVEPILHKHFPKLRYAAARLGHGSEVLGFDDAMSRDHDWGPRLILFLGGEDLDKHKLAIDQALKQDLPHQIHGYSTNWSAPQDDGTWQLIDVQAGPVNHRVEITFIRQFILDYLGFDMSGELHAEDWLSFPQQKLLGVTAGKVFHDDLKLAAIRDAFAWYPHDVWLYLLASTWQRIGQEEHLMGRAGEAGSEVGSALIAARLVRDLMRLCFLMEKRYAPYAKWFGQAFLQLKNSAELNPVLEKILHAKTWQARDRWLARAYEICVRRFNDLGILPKIQGKTTSFYDRPFHVIWGSKIADLILREIKDAELQQLALRTPIGGIDTFSDNTDMLEEAEFRKVLKQLYR